MERKRIESEIWRRRQRIRHLSQHLSRAKCSGRTYSMEEDVDLMEEIEQLEDEVSDLERQLEKLKEQ